MMKTTCLGLTILEGKRLLMMIQKAMALNHQVDNSICSLEGIQGKMMS